jgi:hypothetical protein
MKYMLIDTTVLEETRVIAVALLRQVELMGRLQQAAGRKVIAPPLDGRGFSALDRLPLQYLYWNTTHLPPSEDYGELVKLCQEAVEKIPVDQTPLVDLEREVARVCPQESTSATTTKAPKAPKDPSARPKGISTCGLVWEIADRLYELSGKIPERKEVIEACVKEEINPATASTQFGKWKASKLSTTGS